jgi:hypothetical protein
VSWYLIGVTSNEANALTDKNWNGQYGYWGSKNAISSSSYEVPNDGVISVRMNGPADIALIKQSVTLTSGNYIVLFSVIVLYIV